MECKAGRTDLNSFGCVYQLNEKCHELGLFTGNHHSGPTVLEGSL